MKATKYEIETSQMIVTLEKLKNEDRWIASARSTDLTRQRPTVFGQTLPEVARKFAAELRNAADAIDESLKKDISP